MPRLIHAPHLNSNVVLGGRKRSPQRSRFHFRNYTQAAELPTPPLECDYSQNAQALPILRDVMLNDKYGCCVVAAGYHGEGLVTALTGAPFHASASQIIGDYSAIGHFDPKNPDATDNGCAPSDAIAYWTTHGFANGTKLLGSVDVDAANKLELQQAVYIFEKLFVGLELPDEWVDPMPSGDGFVWDVAGDPNPDNGHMVKIVGYTKAGLIVDTWGIFVIITWAAIAKYGRTRNGGEVHVLFTPDIVARGQTRAPNGFAWVQMIADFNALGGNMPLPAPPPAPSVTPSPYVVKPLPVAAKGIDTSAVLTDAALVDIVAAGGSFCGRYLPSLTTSEITRIHAHGCGLQTFNYSRAPGWVPSAALGAADGARDVAQMKALGLPAGHLHRFDLEGCKGPAAATKAHVEAWAAAVVAAGYKAGLYVGYAPGGLDEAALYALANVTSYMQSCSRCPEPATRGFSQRQLYPGNQKLPHVVVDWDVAQLDFCNSPALATYAAA